MFFKISASSLMWSFTDVDCHIGAAKSQTVKSCTLAEPQNCHLEESPVLVTVQESLDKAMGSSPRGITLYQQVTVYLKPHKGFCPSSATNNAYLPMSDKRGIVFLPPITYSWLHVFFIPIWIKGNHQHPQLIYQKKIFRSLSLVRALHSLIMSVREFRCMDTSLEMPVASRTKAQALACFIYEHRYNHYIFNHNVFCFSASQPIPSSILQPLSVHYVTT